MLNSFIAATVRFSSRHAWAVIFLYIVLCLASCYYVATHFAINTDINGLIDRRAAWAQRDQAVAQAFPQRDEIILAVVDAPAVEFADQAAAELAAKLAGDTTKFHAVSRPEAGDFFERNGLLFLPLADLSKLSKQLTDGRPLLNRLARDPSLAGLSNLLAVTLLLPLQTGQVHLPDMAKLFSASADAVDGALAGQPAALSWRALVAADTHPRAFVQVQPVIDYHALEPAGAASARIHQIASDLHLQERYGARVRLTGSRPLSDDEFGSIREGAVPNAIGSMLVVLVILWIALRSGKLMLAVFATLLVGLSITFALGLLMVGALNLISVAFAVLFVGIGVDFGIQYGTRYREEQPRVHDTPRALVNAGRTIAMPLALAAAATAASFFSFWPTAYRGVSELGEIAGVGILCVAFPSSLTLLPALITVLNPRGASVSTVLPGFHWLAPVDTWTSRHRRPLLIGTLVLVIAGLPLLAHLHFDFNPLHLKDPNSESMAALNSLAGSPEAGVDDVSLLAPSLAAADIAAKKLRQLPVVGRALTLDSFVPDDQPAKLDIVAQMASQLLPVLQQTPSAAAPDAVRVSSLKNAAGQLENAALDYPGAGAVEAQRLAASLRKLAAAAPAARDRAERAIGEPLRISLASLRTLLKPQPISRDNLPPEVTAQWLTADGRALVSISPKQALQAGAVSGGKIGSGDISDRALTEFSDAVTSAEPNASGGPISILHSARTIIRAFYEAGVWALVSITVLLWIALRRFGDVLRTLVPLLVSAAVTLELSVLLGMPLNFANIIALPLLLGIGVAFKIYYVMAWRAGATGLLQSGLTQAIILSAATTGTAFGSLWLSHHPGTSSMGKLLALSLLCTLIGAVFFQPILMGKPRAPAAPTPEA
ncbi:MAG: MMPL family transporter [Janthinobacterium lividum]